MARSGRRRGSPNRPWLIGAGVAALLLLLAGGAWLWLRSDGDGEPSPTAADVGDTAAARDTAADTAAAPANLPDVEASDPVVRDLATRLSSHPRLAEWLVTDDLVRRFVGAVVTVGAGVSPESELEFLEPEGRFRVEERGGSTVIDTASYARYDSIVEAFVSLDTEGTAELYDRLRPLFQEAYRDLGFSRDEFDAAMARAVETLLAVPVPEDPVEVEADGATAFAFRDPELEELSPAQKHLLRMGPENVRRVQAKLEELAEAIGLPVVADGSAEDDAE